MAKLKGGSRVYGLLNVDSGVDLAAVTLGTAAAGVIEYDGTTFYATPDTNYGRGSIPTMIYTSGTGTTLTNNAETTNTTLFPAGNDTITLPVGTYYVMWNVHVTRGASATSATLRVRFGGTATAAFSGTATGSATNASTAQNFNFNSVANGTDMVITPSSTTSGGTYVATITGILRVTVQGTIVPGYSLSALLAVTGAALPASNSLTIQSITTSGSAASTGGWA